MLRPIFPSECPKDRLYLFIYSHPPPSLFLLSPPTPLFLLFSLLSPFPSSPLLYLYFNSLADNGSCQQLLGTTLVLFASSIHANHTLFHDPTITCDLRKAIL